MCWVTERLDLATTLGDLYLPVSVRPCEFFDFHLFLFHTYVEKRFINLIFTYIAILELKLELSFIPRKMTFLSISSSIWVLQFLIHPLG